MNNFIDYPLKYFTRTYFITEVMLLYNLLCSHVIGNFPINITNLFEWLYSIPLNMCITMYINSFFLAKIDSSKYLT